MYLLLLLAAYLVTAVVLSNYYTEKPSWLVLVVAPAKIVAKIGLAVFTALDGKLG